jgi:hypothetical protein
VAGPFGGPATVAFGVDQSAMTLTISTTLLL